MNNTLDLFGLTKEQLEVMYSFEFLITKHDIYSKPKSKYIENKKDWLKQWWMSLKNAGLVGSDIFGRTEESFINYVKQVAQKSFGATWFYMVLLEAVAFTAYFKLEKDSAKDKEYSRLKYTRDADYLKKIVGLTAVGNPEYVDRFIKTYTSAYRKISRKATKTLVKVVVVLAVTAVGAGIAAVCAGPIAVAIFGEQFALSGAALVNACLAMAGGGAIALGGAGIAGGVAAIAGGGALLGLAGGSAAVVGVSSLVKKSPEFALSQSAKLEVVMKEILLNEQKDIVAAQSVLDSLQMQVLTLNSEIEKLKAENKKDKTAISNLEVSVEMLKVAIADMTKFKGAFEVGMSA